MPAEKEGGFLSKLRSSSIENHIDPQLLKPHPELTYFRATSDQFSNVEKIPKLPGTDLLNGTHMKFNHIKGSCEPAYVANMLMRWMNESGSEKNLTRDTPARIVEKNEDSLNMVFNGFWLNKAVKIEMQPYVLPNNEFAIEFQRIEGDGFLFGDVYREMKTNLIHETRRGNVSMVYSEDDEKDILDKDDLHLPADSLDMDVVPPMNTFGDEIDLVTDLVNDPVNKEEAAEMFLSTINNAPKNSSMIRSEDFVGGYFFNQNRAHSGTTLGDSNTKPWEVLQELITSPHALSYYPALQVCNAVLGHEEALRHLTITSTGFTKPVIYSVLKDTNIVNNILDTLSDAQLSDVLVKRQASQIINRVVELLMVLFEEANPLLNSAQREEVINNMEKQLKNLYSAVSNLRRQYMERTTTMLNEKFYFSQDEVTAENIDSCYNKLRQLERHIPIMVQ